MVAMSHLAVFVLHFSRCKDRLKADDKFVEPVSFHSEFDHMVGLSLSDRHPVSTQVYHGNRILTER